MTGQLFTKEYPSKGRCEAAVRNYTWLRKKAQSLRLPQLMDVGNATLGFEHIAGRHAHPSDLPRLAELMGRTHGEAWASELRAACLDQPWKATVGVLPDFLRTRQEALDRRVEAGYLAPAHTLARLLRTLERTAAGPAAFYKDSNPRNFLITTTGAVYVVDFDDLTLAPFGYDLAKLLHTLALAHGRLSTSRMRAARDAYNRATTRYGAGLTVSEDDLIGHLQLHHVLTAPYHDRPHYPHAPTSPGRPE